MKITNSTVAATYALPLIVNDITIDRGYLVEIITGDTELSDTDYKALQLIPYFQERITVGDYVIEQANIKQKASPTAAPTADVNKI